MLALSDERPPRGQWKSHLHAGRLLEVANTSASATLSRFTYALDDVGNRVALTTRQGTVTYQYDDLNRLTEACWSQTSCPGGAPAAPLTCLACIGGLITRPSTTVDPPSGETYRTYTYDPVGNRLTESSDSGTTTYEYDAADRLTTVTDPAEAVTTYSFDDNGNQTAAGDTTYTYDLADRLATATVGSTTETYTYAGDGVRLSASTGAAANQTTKYLWDRIFGLPQLAIERDGNNSLLRYYRYGLDLLRETAGSNTYYYHPDGLGSAADVTSSTGTSLTWSEFYPHGIVRQAGVAGTGAPAVQPFGFTGEQLDSITSLYYLRARQYDPGTGRFLTTDPVATPASDQYVSAYTYARSNPALLTDPSGQCPLCILGAIGAAVGGAIGGVSYAVTAGNDFSVGGLIGATAGGAIAGATVATSGIIGGSVAALMGASSTGATAVALTAGINFLGGATGNAVATVGAGHALSAETMVGAGIFNAGAGLTGNTLWPLHGVNTLSQATYFAPRMLAGLLSGTNASLAWRNALFGGLTSTWSTAASIGSSPK
jgi:RHS repeat-associated protein